MSAPFRPTFSKKSLSTWAVGAVLDATNSYAPVFIGLSLLMPIGLALGFLPMGRVEPIRDFDHPTPRVA